MKKTIVLWACLVSACSSVAPSPIVEQTTDYTIYVQTVSGAPVVGAFVEAWPSQCRTSYLGRCPVRAILPATVRVEAEGYIPYRAQLPATGGDYTAVVK